MKTLTVSTFSASGLAALCLGLSATAPQAAPSGPTNGFPSIKRVNGDATHTF